MINTNTKAQEVFDSFESSFKDKVIIPASLEQEWLLRAIAKYSVELETLDFDEVTGEFNGKINRYAIDTLAALMKQYYQEREVSRVNKMVSIVTRDVSIDSKGTTKSSTRAELEYCERQSDSMIFNQKPTAYN